MTTFDKRLERLWSDAPALDLGLPSEPNEVRVVR